MAGDLHGMALRKQLEQKLQEAAKSRKVAEQALESARALLEQAKGLDTPVAEAEAALAEATSAYASKNYKVAADRAAEAKERGRRALEARVKSVVDSSALLLELTGKLGADVSDAEQALKKAREAAAAEDLPTAMDFAKRGWKRSEKVLHEHLSSRFTSAQSLIVASKNIGKDVKAAEELLAKARGAVENQDFELALSYTKECLDNIASGLRDEVERPLQEADALSRLAAELGVDTAKARGLQEKARYEMDRGEFEKALETARHAHAETERLVQRTLETRAADFQRLAQQAEEFGASTARAREIQRNLELALREKRFADAHDLIRRTHEELHNAQLQAVLAIVGRSREKFVTAKAVGADITRALDFLNEARGALQAGRFREAVEFAKRADAEVDRIAGEAVDLMQRVQGITRGIAEGERDGLNTAAARRHMEVAKRAMEQKDIQTVREQVRQAGEELSRAEYDRAMETIEQAEFILTSGEKAGADLTDSRTALEDAIASARKKDFRTAIGRASASRAGAESSVRRILGGRLDGLKAALSFMGPDATSVRSLIVKTEAAVEARDFEGAFVYLEEAQKLAEGKTQDKAREFAKDLRGLIELGDALGADTRTVVAVLREVSPAIEHGRFAETLAVREKSTKGVATLVEDLFNLVKEKVVEAKSLNLDITELRDLLKKGRLAVDTEDYSAALRVLAECDARAEQAMKLHKETYAAISTVAALIADAKKRGGEVTAALEMLLEAKRAFEAAEYPRALQLASQARDETKRIMQLYAAGQQIKAARERMDLSAQVGVDLPHLKALLEEARDAMKNKDYEAALTLGQRVESEGLEAVRDKVTTLLTAAETLLASAEGPDVATHERRILAARERAEQGDWAAAVALAEEARAELEGLHRRSEEGQVAVNRAEDLVTEVEAMNIDVPGSRKLLDLAKKALRSGQPEQAAELATKGLAEIASERDASIQKTMRRFDESLAQARKAGVNTKSAEKVLAKAQEELKTGRYRQALALAMQSEKETERASVQQEMASKAIATAVRKMEAYGAPAPHVASLVADAKRAFEEGDYVLALDLAIRTGDELSKLRELQEDTKEVRQAAKRVLEVAKLLAPEVPLHETFAAGEEAMAAGDLDRAQGHFQKMLDQGVKTCAERLEVLHARAIEGVDAAERIGLDVGPARAKLSEAKALALGENFDQALQLLTGMEEEVRRLAEAKVSEVLRTSSESIAHARDMGANTAEADAILARAEGLLRSGSHEEALRAALEAVQRVAARREPEHTFMEVAQRADATLRSARRFGIDVREAEALLSEAIKLRGSDQPRAREMAEQAYQAGFRAIEAFAPKIEASLEKGEAQAGEWLETVLVLRNQGRALAKDVRVRILGDVEVEGKLDAPTIRARGEERLPLRLKFTEKGVVPLAVQVTSVRLIDGKDFTEEVGVQVEVRGVEEEAEEVKPLIAEIETSCPFCRGKIRRGLPIAKCECGRDYHQPCASRAGTCVSCGKPLRTTERKKKLSFKLG